MNSERSKNAELTKAVLPNKASQESIINKIIFKEYKSGEILGAEVIIELKMLELAMLIIELPLIMMRIKMEVVFDQKKFKFIMKYYKKCQVYMENFESYLNSIEKSEMHNKLIERYGFVLELYEEFDKIIDHISL